MRSSFVPVTTSLYLREREKWLAEIKRGENISIVFFPKTDRFRRLHQLLEDRDFLRNYFGTGKKYLFQLTDFNVSLVEDKFDIQEHIARQLNESNLSATAQTFTQWMAYFARENIRFVLILPDAEKYLTPENKHIPPLLLALSIDFAPTLTLMNLFETDIMHPSLDPILTLGKDLYENLFWYPLYDEADVREFLHYLEKKWEMNISKKQEDLIVESCGGHFWLVKEGVRELLNEKKVSLDNESMFFRIDTIFQALHKSEQLVLEKIISRNKQLTHEETRSRVFLIRMNALSDKNKLKIGFFHQYLTMRPMLDQRIEMLEGRVFINNVMVDAMFTRKEHRAFGALLDHKGGVVSRDMLAKAIWPVRTDEQYSDWAIDQLMTRLRKRLVQLSLSPKLIHVVRGKGYRLNY